MEARDARAISRNIAISPRKLNAFVDVVRGLSIQDALIQCRMHPKKAAGICEKVILSAKANAVNNHGLAEARLMVEQAWVGKGRYQKRTSLHGRGRSGVRHKYRAHLTVVLKEGDVPRRTRVVPMLLERKKWWDMREGAERAPGAAEGVQGRQWWRWWPRKEVPPGAMRGKQRDMPAAAVLPSS